MAPIMAPTEEKLPIQPAYLQRTLDMDATAHLLEGNVFKSFSALARRAGVQHLVLPRFPCARLVGRGGLLREQAIYLGDALLYLGAPIRIGETGRR